MILGLTGGIGSGKSVALRIFASLGAETFDADALVHQLYEEIDSPLVRKLAARWGKRIIAADGQLDRRRLGEIVFADPAELDFLTGLVYPALDKRLAKHFAAARRSRQPAVFEIPLLFECGWESRFDAVIAVYAEPAVRHARLQARGMTAATVALREERQFAAEKKLELADYGLINNHSETILKEQIIVLMNHLKQKENT